MSKKILGIDVGVASVGWGIIDQEGNILGSGVRLFEEPNQDANAKRREFRGGRRLKSRRKIRIKDMNDLLIDHKIINKDTNLNDVNPYYAREKGLTTKLSNAELAAALLQTAKRRGSSLEVAEDESEDGTKTKAILARHATELKEKYVVQLQLEKFEKDGKIRDQENIFKTEDYVKETLQILKNQDVSVDFINKAIKIIERKRHFSEGPGSIKSPTPYGRWRPVNKQLEVDIVSNFSSAEQVKYLKQKFLIKYKEEEYVVLKSGQIINKMPLNLIDIMRGKCSVYPNELRAPKNSYSALKYNFLNEINNMKIVKDESRSFTYEEKQKALDVIKEYGKFTPNNINGFLKIFSLDINDVIGYRINEKEKPIITEFKIYEKLLMLFKEYEVKLTDEVADNIAEILTNNLVIEERKTQLIKFISNERLAQKVADLTGYSGYHSLSFKALRLLNKEMLETEQNQQQILANNLLKENKKITKLHFDETLILSSVARRAHREALKVINELLKEFGHIERIVIETTREKNSAEEKKRINENQKYYAEQNKNAIELLKDKGYGDGPFSNHTLLKIKLYEEQFGKCAYSGTNINLEKLITDPHSYEIDHIIPRSISQDNSQNNKVLVLNEVNQLKGNRTPFYYFTSGQLKTSYPINNYNAFKAYVLGNENYKKNVKKRKNLLNEEDITKYDSLEEFVNRNLIDTSYAARSLMTTLKTYFKSNEINTTVVTIKGKQTSMFRGIARGLWNHEYRNLPVDLNPFNKDRNKYIHHAVDALIIAGLSNQKTLKYLFELETTKKEKYVARQDTGEIFNVDPTRDSKLIKFLKNIGKIKDNDVRFSWKVDKKINRGFSDQTIYSTRQYEGKEYVINTYKNIYELDSKKLSNIFENEKESEKLLVYQHDRKTYDLIKSAFLQYKHENYPLKAFMQEHGKIRKNNVGPEVNNLKYRKNVLGNHIDITKKQTKNKKEVLLQISPYRIDIYKDENENYKFVTIRFADFSLDDKGYYIDNNLYKEKLKQKKINKNYKYVFSFNRNEVFQIKEKEKEIETYRFIGIGSDSDNKIELKSINQRDEKRVIKTIGRGTEIINKYAASPAGRINKVCNEKLTLVR